MQVTNLRAYLVNINMTMKQFARLIGYSPQYICAVLRGDQKPSECMVRAVKKETHGIIDLPYEPREIHKNSKTYKEKAKAANE